MILITETSVQTMTKETYYCVCVCASPRPCIRGLSGSRSRSSPRHPSMVPGTPLGTTSSDRRRVLRPKLLATLQGSTISCLQR